MHNEVERQRILQLLNYWHVLDFFKQESAPNKQELRPHQQNGKVSGYDAKVLLGELADGTADDLLSSRIDAKLKAYVGSRGVRYYGKSEKHFTASDLSATRGDEFRHATQLHLGRIPREDLISYLWGTGDTRVESAVSNITGALLHVSPTYAFEGLEISPILWAAWQRHANPTGDFKKAVSVSNYHRDCAERNSKLKETFGDRPLTLRDVKAIMDDFLAPLLRPVAEARGLPSGSAQEFLTQIYVEQSVTNTDKGPELTTLNLSFYATEIEQIAKVIEGGRSLDDLEGSQLTLALHYLEAGPEENPGRVELLSNSENDAPARKDCLDKILAFDSAPLGRWPSRYSLSLMQQIAVNLASGPNRKTLDPPAGDIMSVNGPPGTGKTTLLKDLIAATIVEKAHLLAEYERPDDAFKKLPLEKGTSYHNLANEMYLFMDERINDLGIVVCSSNNDAVENISKELPSANELLKGITGAEQKEFLEDDLSRMPWHMGKGTATTKRDLYFSYAAFNQFEKDYVKLENYDDREAENLHLLLSARLGNGRNISAFTYRTLNPLLRNLNNRDMKRPSLSYKVARELFLEQFNRVKGLLDEATCADRELASCRIARAESRDRVEAATRNLQASWNDLEFSRKRGLQLIKSRAGFYGVQLSDASPGDLKRSCENLSMQLDDYTSERKHLENVYLNAQKVTKSQVNSLKTRFLGGGRSLAEAQANEEDARYKLEEFKNSHRRYETDLKELVSELWAIVRQCESATRAYNEQQDALRQAEEANAAAKIRLEEAELKAKVARALVMGEGAGYPSASGDLADGLVSKDPNDRKAAHLFNPYAGEALMHERDLLFLRALQLTREFILSSNCVKENLQYLMAYWTGKATKEEVEFSSKDKKAIAPAAFQTLNLVTPVISTTFASVKSLFFDIEIKAGSKAPLGILVIDEAGQALPYAALGALARCRRAMIVGDPFQTEPIYPQETLALRSAIAGEMDSFYTGIRASAQQFGDAANPYGQYRQQDDSVMWVGCPLTIHRRCISPMFDISNEVSYENSMLNETPALDPSKPAEKQLLDSFYLPSSQWLNVAGNERGNRDHYVDKQGKRAVEILRSAFEKRPEGQDLPSLFIISPFTSVVHGIKNALRPIRAAELGVTEAGWDKFLNCNIGTVHKFQGKEALEVIFILGCDSTVKGAVNFVGPNIVNVAASRAKQRLYVIGDITVWKDNPSVRTMKQILDTAWVEHWEKYQKTDDPAELLLAQQMAPIDESLPRLKDDEGNETLCTDIFEENVAEFTKLLSSPISNEKCRQLGFAPLSALEQTLSKREEGGKRILSKIKLGMNLYWLFGCSQSKNDEVDGLSSAIQDRYSTVVHMFTLAANCYLDECFLPALKETVPDYLLAKNQKPLGDRDMVTLGQYARIVGETKNATELAYNAQLGDPSSPGVDSTWWKGLSKSVDRVAKTRNKACHPEGVSCAEVDEVLACMGLRGECDTPQIMMQGEVYDAVASGAHMGRPEAFDLADARRHESDERSCSFSVLKKSDKSFAGLTSSQVLNWLDNEGLIENGEFDGAAGRFPTEKGFRKHGILWRRFDNEDTEKAPSSGIYFSPEAQAWLRSKAAEIARWASLHV